MVKRFFQIISREISGLHQAAYILAGFTFLSQLLGLMRDRLLAHTFGADLALDIYYAAFRIPDLILVFAASIASISILVPYLTEKLQTGKEQGKEFIDTIFSAFFVIIVGASIVIYFLIPLLLPLMFPGFKGENLETLITMTRILLLSPIFLGLSNLFASIVQVYRRFLIYALSPIFYNVGIIFGIVVLYPIFGINGLAYGVVLGAVLHLGVQIPTVASHSFIPRFKRRISWKSVSGVIGSSLPRAFTLSINQIAVIALLGLASTFIDGSIAIFNFSLNLQSVPLTIVGVSYSLAAFPTLSRFFAEGRHEEFLEQVTTALRHIIFWSIPAVALFIILRAHIVRTVLGTGEFGWDATRLTAAALALFVLSVIAQGIVLLFIRSYYAMGNTKLPLYHALLSGAIIIGGAFALSSLFTDSSFFRRTVEEFWRVRDVPGTIVLMLPLAYSIGIYVNMILLWRSFEKHFNGFTRRVLATLWQSLAAAIITGFVAYTILAIISFFFEIDTVLGIFLHGFVAGVAGIAAGVVVLIALHNNEIAEMFISLKRRFRHVEVMVPDTEEL